MRTLIVALFAILLLAACGDDSSPTPTPTEPAVAPGQQTPNSDACAADDVNGKLVSTGAAAGHFVITLEVGQAARNCTFTGPPEIRWYDSEGKALGVPYTPSDACESGAEGFGSCVYADPIEVSPSAASVTAAVRAVVQIADVALLPACTAQPLKGKVIGLQFPQTPLDVQITLPQEIELQTCSAQVNLYGYGPINED